MLRRLNPFKGIIGPKYARHALTLNTTYMEKVRNTFLILNGSLPYYGFRDGWSMPATTGRERYGVLDFIPFLGADVLLTKISRLSFSLKDLTQQLPMALGLPIQIIFAVPFIALNVAITAARFAMHAIRFVASVAITAAAALTIVPVVHGFASWAYNSLMSLVGKMGVKLQGRVAPEEAIINAVKNSSGITYSKSAKSTTLEIYNELSITVDCDKIINATKESDAITRGMNALLQLNFGYIANQVAKNSSYTGSGSKGLEDGQLNQGYMLL